MNDDLYSQLQLLYVAYFGRPGDPAGINYWVAQGIDQRAFSRMVYGQPEFQGVVLSRDLRAQVNSLYQNLFGRAGDAEGLDYWTQAISQGRLSLATLGIDLIYAARRLANQDSKVLDAKLAAARAWTTTVASNVDLQAAYQPLSWSPWDSGGALLNGITFLSTVRATDTRSVDLSLNRALVGVKAVVAARNPPVDGALLSPEARSLIDPNPVTYNTVFGGAVQLSPSEWTRFSAKPVWSGSDLGYVHYYYLRDGHDGLALTSQERTIWTSVFDALNGVSESRFLPLRFQPVASADQATIAIYNDNALPASLLGQRSSPISGAGVVSGFWQLIATSRDSITGIASRRGSSFAELYRFTALHELGHALGLDHPFERVLWPGVSAQDDPYRSGPSPQQTVMTYNLGAQSLPLGYSAVDQQALQAIWGTPASPNLAFGTGFQAAARQALADGALTIPSAAVPGLVG